MITEHLKRLRQDLEVSKKGNPAQHKAIMDNLGLILRLMFQKTQYVCN